MGFLTNGLSFNTLRSANLARLPLFKSAAGEPAHSEQDGSDWSVAEWFMATAGELGELGNLLKKVVRGDLEMTLEQVIEARDTTKIHLPEENQTSRTDRPSEAVKVMLADELADVVIYLDLLAHRLGIDLGGAVMRKWNKTSRKNRVPISISADDWRFTDDDEPTARDTRVPQTDPDTGELIYVTRGD